MLRLTATQKRLLAIVLVLVVLAVALPYCYRITRPTQILIIVRDSETGEFLGDTLVEVQNPNGQTLIDLVTLADGTGAVKRLAPDAEYRVLARHIDYVPAVRTNVMLNLHETAEVRIPLRPKPGGRLYVGLDEAYIASIDTASLLFESYARGPEAMRRWPVRHLAVAPGRPWLYASARYAHFVMEPTQMDPVAELALTGAVQGLGLTRDGQSLLALVRQGGEDRVAIMSADTGASQGNVLVQPMVREMEGTVPPEAHVFLVGDAVIVQGSQGISAFFPDAILGQMGFAPNMRWVAMAPNGRHLYMGSPVASFVAKVNLDTQRPEVFWDLGRNISAAAVHPSGQELYLADAELGLLLVVNAESGEVTAQVPVGREPVAVAVGPAGDRVYVANGDSGDVSIMDVATRQIIDTVSLGERPFSLAVR